MGWNLWFKESFKKQKIYKKSLGGQQDLSMLALDQKLIFSTNNKKKERFKSFPGKSTTPNEQLTHAIDGRNSDSRHHNYGHKFKEKVKHLGNEADI